jgi:hypothetical protein
MAEIRLLAAPVILSPAVNSASTGIVPATRFAMANRTAASDSAYPNDSYVWSVATGDNGSFQFYAAPLKNFLNSGTSSQQDESLSAYMLTPNWTALNASNAVAQYQLASIPLPLYGHLLNVFA